MFILNTIQNLLNAIRRFKSKSNRFVEKSNEFYHEFTNLTFLQTSKKNEFVSLVT